MQSLYLASVCSIYIFRESKQWESLLNLAHAPVVGHNNYYCFVQSCAVLQLYVYVCVFSVIMCDRIMCDHGCLLVQHRSQPICAAEWYHFSNNQRQRLWSVWNTTGSALEKGLRMYIP